MKRGAVKSGTLGANIYLQLLTVLFFSSGKSCDVELLESFDSLTDRQRGWGLDYLDERVHLITPKSI